MKKIFLVFITLLLGLHSAWGHDVEVDGIFYNLNTQDKTAEVTYGSSPYSGGIVIPEKIIVDGTGYSVTSLGEACFAGCSGLTFIMIPNSVTSLGNACFVGCSGLTSITIPYSVTSLGESCFDGCFSLTSIAIPESVTSLGGSCFERCFSLTSITIPNSVTSLGNRCFWNCSSLTSITIPNSVTSLGDVCFCMCSSLTSITIPNSVSSLGSCCFGSCDGLKSIVVAADNPVYDSRDNCNAIIKTSTNQMIVACNNSYIPNTVTSLGDDCFYGCNGMTSITIPESVTSLGDDCFWDCESLTSITIPKTVTNLGRSCFSYCESLTSITIPESVTSLGSWCFWNCSSLTSITMLPLTPPTVGTGIFDQASMKTVYVADEYAKSLYEMEDPWKAYEIIPLNTGIENAEMGDNAARITGCYDLNGRRISGKQSGPVIVRYSDGTTRKVMVK